MKAIIHLEHDLCKIPFSSNDSCSLDDLIMSSKDDEWEISNFQSEHSDNLVTERSNNGIVNAFLLAYNTHMPLRLSPDHMDLILKLVYTNIVNSDPESFRDIFVDHHGKKTLTVEVDNVSAESDHFFQLVLDRMSSEIAENIKNPGFLQVMKPEYSTTTPLSLVASQVLIMDSIKDFFKFEVVCDCGIPSVILDGSIEDWQLLLQKYELAKKYFSGSSEIRDWYEKMDILMNMFVEMRRLTENGEASAPAWIRELWKYVIAPVPHGSGGDTVLGGWISVLQPFDGQKKIKPMKDLDYFPVDGKRKEAPDQKNYHCEYQWQGDMQRFFSADSYNAFNVSLSDTPMVLNDNGQVSDLVLKAGFSRHAYRDHTYVSPNIQFAVLKKNLTVQDERERYIAQGFKVKGSMLMIPKDIYDNDFKNERTGTVKRERRLLKLFGVPFYTYYVPS